MSKIKTSIIITQNQIQKKVQELTQKINKKFKSEPLIAIGVLKGSFIFYSDLIRQLSGHILCDFCITSSYGKNKQASEEVKLIMDVSLNIANKHILIIEDIVDRGLTLKFLKSHFQNRKPLSIHTVALITKQHKPEVDYVGFEIQNSSFLVGYGMDYQEQFREFPYIAEINLS